MKNYYKVYAEYTDKRKAEKAYTKLRKTGELDTTSAYSFGISKPTGCKHDYQKVGNKVTSKTSKQRNSNKPKKFQTYECTLCEAYHVKVEE